MKSITSCCRALKAPTRSTSRSSDPLGLGISSLSAKMVSPSGLRPDWKISRSGPNSCLGRNERPAAGENHRADLFPVRSMWLLLYARISVCASVRVTDGAV